MKGITPIIAIMLLMMVTIAMIGFAYFWFTKIMDRAKNNTEEMMKGENEKYQKTIAIDSLSPQGGDSYIYIRNTGTGIVYPSELSFYVAGAMHTCVFTDPLIQTNGIVPGVVAPCKITGTNCSGLDVKVTGPGNTDDLNC